jgi:transcriptional regulator with XRE-family HTH domain
VRIVHLIEAAGLTDREVGARIGVTQQSVNRWRRGEQVPGVERAELLAAALGVTEDVIISAVIADLKARSRRDERTNSDEELLLAAACSIVESRGTSSLSLRSVSEHCGVPITDVANRWRTRDDLAKAALNHALANARPATIEVIVRSHLDSFTRVGPEAVWRLPGMSNAVAAAGGTDSLIFLVGAAVVGVPESERGAALDRSAPANR